MTVKVTDYLRELIQRYWSPTDAEEEEILEILGRPDRVDPFDTEPRVLRHTPNPARVPEQKCQCAETRRNLRALVFVVAGLTLSHLAVLAMLAAD